MIDQCLKLQSQVFWIAHFSIYAAEIVADRRLVYASCFDLFSLWARQKSIHETFVHWRQLRYDPNPILYLFNPMHRSSLLCLAGLALVAGLRDFPEDTVSITLGLEKKHKSECERKSYRKYVLKLVKETPFAGLFRDVKNQVKH